MGSPTSQAAPSLAGATAHESGGEELRQIRQGGSQRLPELLLLLPLVATVALAWVHVRSVRQHRLAVESASVDVTGVMLRDVFDVLAARTRRAAAAGLGYAVNEVARREFISPTAPLETQRLVTGILSALDSVAACACGPTLPVLGAFVYEVASGEVSTSGRVPLPADVAIARLGSLDFPPPPAGGAVRVLSAAGTGPPAPWLAFLVVLRFGDETLVVGVDVDVDSVGDALVRPAHEEIAEGFLPDADAPTEKFGLTVADPAGRVVYQTRSGAMGPEYHLPVWGPGYWDSGVPGSEDFLATASLSRSLLAQMIPGGLPRSPVPLVSATLLTAVGLSVVALLLLARGRRLLRMREEFVASVSHEFRTPLSQILLYAETLQMAEPPEETRSRAASVIAREARRLSHLVESSLAFVRSQRPEVGFDPTPLDLTLLTSEVVREQRATWAHRDVRIETVDGDDSVALVCVDGPTIRSAIRNLIDNAVRFGPDSQTVRVRISDEPMRIEVEDEGNGIPLDERRAVWEPFVRGTNAHAGSGSGIGLALVLQAARLHGGDVFVAEGPRGGAVVGFWIGVEAVERSRAVAPPPMEV